MNKVKQQIQIKMEKIFEVKKQKAGGKNSNGELWHEVMQVVKNKNKSMS